MAKKSDTTAALLHKKVQRVHLPKKGAVKKAAVSQAHRAVIDAYFANGCVSQRRALHACGYSDKSPVVSVFGREDVRSEIDRRHKLQSRRRDLTEDRIKEEYAKIAFSNLGDLLEVNEDGSAYLDLTKLTEDQKAAMAEYQVETYVEKTFEEGEDGEKGTVIGTPVKKSRIKFHSKLAALDSLARIMGLFKDRVEVSHTQSLVERIAAARQRTNAAMKGGIT